MFTNKTYNNIVLKSLCVSEGVISTVKEIIPTVVDKIKSTVKKGINKITDRVKKEINRIRFAFSCAKGVAAMMAA